MTKIIKLDDALSNKIAAGEVVERPASIVKELVENALDANSSQIIVQIEEGGLSSIRIIDNGDGIASEEVETAFYRHATSKIRTDRDLFQIGTLGFRGEALPSIASVAFVSMTTNTGSGPGTGIVIEGGVIKEKKAAKARKGTEIQVTNLFYNTPARLKYLKTVHTEAGNVSDIVNRLALAHPHVSFEYSHDGKEVLKTSGNGDIRQVIASIYGRNVAKKVKHVEGRSLDYEISGFVGMPELTRASRQYMSIFVNGRYIRNYALARSIQDGYHTLLPIGRYPLVVLSIKMDPKLIDVNVHPSKLEVRLSKEEELGQLITQSIKRLFETETLIPSADTKQRTNFESYKSEQVSFDFDTPIEARTSPTIQVKEEQYEALASPEKGYDRLIQTDSTYENPLPQQNKEREQQESSQENVVATNIKEVEPRKVETKEEESILERVPVLYPVGQMHGTYIIAQNETGMYLIDQHAAQERVKYEFFRDKVAEVSPHVQELLVPITLECTAQEFSIINEHLDDLHTVGVFPEQFGTQAFIIRSHPTWLPKGQEEETIREIIDYLLENRSVNLKKLREEAAILMSCKAAIKANRHLRQDEMFALLESLRKSSDPFTCPHGRPILVHFSTYALEKMFKRVM
ncbi:DNA mismatch repair endonuclease MutL [Alkalihalobacillus sp. MEB130]|uniref:DNA mismatch repair endonuclease MutL n=1 Tax=Alkalihalobacillus sp. MEB130 TaxID=2976704 RepID=UPI0028DF5E78|nr:DNA mismatch repair endonuclease MutL [Alkalihalobacillus sp. MEB130]MDT8862857.1 DNA mismatch repair endonuclease MutL [Alkalihalobacillus sp. MEB130]